MALVGWRAVELACVPARVGSEGWQVGGSEGACGTQLRNYVGDSMDLLRQAAQQMVTAMEADPDAMVEVTEHHWHYTRDLALDALRAALAQPKQEPVGNFSINDYGLWEQNENGYGTPLYTHPPQRNPLRTVIYACPICAASLERQE
jgi:hypothetical protein